ncbi:NusA-like transcription termination signal-binding factor [Candidatus Woesearchaeota archaeon]|nr:NusA-like transcription termination signal-binding factor [Candidatus Woesearchaeota archaeon]
MAAKIKLDIETMKCISLFGKITKVTAKDCFKQDKKLIFIVDEGKAGMAVGKKGANIKKLEKLLNKKVKIIEQSDDLIEFVKNVIYPLKAKEISENEGIVTIVPIDNKTRGYLIGREASNLRNYEEVVKRYFDIEELKVSQS